MRNESIVIRREEEELNANSMDRCLYMVIFLV
jgi:hypothetical protein